MRKNFSHYKKIILIILFIAIIFIPHPVFAGWFGDEMKSVLSDVIGIILTPIASLILGIMSLFTMITGVFLNQVVFYTVVNMSKTLPNDSISTTWGILRDIANMSFIFILLYTSILLIIGQRSINDARKLIVNVVIAAILINFSMFFTRLVIDAGNLIALVFYKAVAPGALEAGATFTNRGVSNSITNVLGISTLWKEVGTLANTKIITVGIFGSMLLLISAFVFAAVGLLLLIRYVILVFVIIFSPVAFVADVIPGAKPYFKKWKDALFNNAFFPAIFFLVLWVALTILNAMKGKIGATDGSLADAFGTGTSAGGASFTSDNVALIVNFIIVIMFVVGSLLLSKSMASKTGYGVDKIVGRATGLAGSGTFGMAGRLGRGTIGRAGNAIANSERLKGMAPDSRMARLALAAGQKTAKQSFDARATGIGKQTGAGTAQKGGFKKDVENRVKAETERAKSYKASDAFVKEVDRVRTEAINEHTQARATAAKKFEDEHPRPTEDAINANKKIVSDVEREIEEADALALSPEEREELNVKLENAKASVTRSEAEHKADLDRYENEKKIAVSQATMLEAEKERAAQESAWQVKNRQERYAQKVEKAMRPSLLDRVGFFGKIKRENIEAAAAIRKAAKEKTKEEKLVELSAEVAEERAKKKKEEEAASGTSATVEGDGTVKTSADGGDKSTSS